VLNETVSACLWLGPIAARPPVAAGEPDFAEVAESPYKGNAMHDTCEYINHCGFFRKYGERRSNVWRGLVGFYCQGRGFSLCERRNNYLNNVTQISDDILPSGQEVSKAFLALK
jgi:hypothetical protein